jgi:hypothetical protein
MRPEGTKAKERQEMSGESHIPVAYRDHSDAWIECSCGWGSFGSNGEEWLEHYHDIDMCDCGHSSIKHNFGDEECARCSCTRFTLREGNK